MGKPNDPEFQKKVIRAAFELLEASGGPVIEDFPARKQLEGEPWR